MDKLKDIKVVNRVKDITTMETEGNITAIEESQENSIIHTTDMMALAEEAESTKTKAIAKIPMVTNLTAIRRETKETLNTQRRKANSWNNNMIKNTKSQ